MAIINKLRSNKWVMVVVLVTLALFVLSDLISGKSSFTSGSESIGSIDGNTISIAEFDGKYNALLAQIEAGGQGGTPEEKKDQASTYAWNQLIQSYLIEKEYDKIGITVGKDEAGKLLYSDDAHPTIKQYFSQDGVFNPNNVIQFKNQVAKKDPKMMEQFDLIIDQIVFDVKSRKYNSMLSKSIYATSLDAEDDYYASSNQVTGTSLTLNFSSIEDKDIKIEESDLKAYYKKHKKEYKQDESRDLEYTMISLVPSSNDTLAIKNDLLDLSTRFNEPGNDTAFAMLNSEDPQDPYYQSRGSFDQLIEKQLFSTPKDSVVGPLYFDGGFSLYKVLDKKTDSVMYYNAIMIQIPVGGTTTADTAAAIAKAKSIAAENKDPNGAFGFFQDKYFQGQLGTVSDLKWFRQGTQSKDINEAVKSMTLGSSAIIKTPYGPSLLVLTSSPSNQLVKLASIRKKIDAKSETLDSIYNKLAEVREQLESGDAKFDDVLKKFNFNKSIANNIRPSDKMMTGIPGTKGVVTWAYNEKREEGEVSDIIITDEFYILAILSKIKEEGLSSFEDVKDRVKMEVMNEKKAEMLIAKIEEAKKSSKNIEEIATKLKTVAFPINGLYFNAPSVEGTGNDVSLVGYAFGLKPKTMSRPITSNVGVSLIYVSEFKKAENPVSIQSRQEILYSSKKQQIPYLAYEVLKKAAKVKDQRYKFY